MKSIIQLHKIIQGNNIIVVISKCKFKQDYVNRQLYNLNSLNLNCRLTNYSH